MPKKNKGASKAPNTKALEKVVNKMLAAVRAGKRDLLAQGLVSLTPDARLHSSGKLREGEEEMMIDVLDTMDQYPGVFIALAPHDHGKDDKVVETGPARGALARRALFAPLAKELGDLLTCVGDDVLASGELAKDVTGPAYAIIRANAEVLPALRTSAARAIGYYAGIAKPKKGGKKDEKAEKAATEKPKA